MSLCLAVCLFCTFARGLCLPVFLISTSTFVDIGIDILISVFIFIFSLLVPYFDPLVVWSDRSVIVGCNCTVSNNRSSAKLVQVDEEGTSIPLSKSIVLYYVDNYCEMQQR